MAIDISYLSGTYLAEPAGVEVSYVSGNFLVEPSGVEMSFLSGNYLTAEGESAPATRRRMAGFVN